jgi:predicted DNA-binding transcriptional regulator YafY
MADVLDEPANPPPDAELRDLSEGIFTPAPEHLLAVLRLAPTYAWVADYYPTESETAEPSGRRVISVRVADPAWVRALALGSAGQVEVLSPEWLAESIRDGICAFELRWKSKRLSKDLDGMQTLRDELVTVQGQLAAAQQRLSRHLSE